MHQKPFLCAQNIELFIMKEKNEERCLSEDEKRDEIRQTLVCTTKYFYENTMAIFDKENKENEKLFHIHQHRT